LNAIDELYTDRPHLGRYGMTDALAEERQIHVNPKRVRRLMKKLGLEAVYPRPRKHTSQPSPEHLKYPYLLRNLEIAAPDQVWCADITYIRLHRGFAYLVAVMDWFTRCVLSWELSNTLDTTFCVEALKQALGTGRRPEIFNTDATLRSSEVLLRYEARARAASSRARRSRRCSPRPELPSAWTGWAGRSTISWSSGCGGR
jgi:putative transposase